MRLRLLYSLFFAGLVELLSATPSSAAEALCASILDHRIANLQDQPVSLCQFGGKVLLIVNTASECGYTPQYEGLEKLYRRYREKGFVILGFPANDFGGQEPGSNAEIAQFCRLNYGVTFPMFAKTSVVGATQTRSIARLPRGLESRHDGTSTSISSTGRRNRSKCLKVPSRRPILGLLRKLKNCSLRADPGRIF